MELFYHAPNGVAFRKLVEMTSPLVAAYDFVGEGKVHVGMEEGVVTFYPYEGELERVVAKNEEYPAYLRSSSPLTLELNDTVYRMLGLSIRSCALIAVGEVPVGLHLGASTIAQFDRFEAMMKPFVDNYVIEGDTGILIATQNEDHISIDTPNDAYPEEYRCRILKKIESAGEAPARFIDSTDLSLLVGDMLVRFDTYLEAWHDFEEDRSLED